MPGFRNRTPKGPKGPVGQSHIWGRASKGVRKRRHDQVYSHGTLISVLLNARKYNMKTTRKHESLPPAASRKVVVDFPAPLFRETERAVAEIGTNRSKLIRCAVEQYLETLQRKRLEQELATGYVANSALDRRISEEFSAVDYEAF